MKARVCRRGAAIVVMVASMLTMSVNSVSASGNVGPASPEALKAVGETHINLGLLDTQHAFTYVAADGTVSTFIPTLRQQPGTVGVLIVNTPGRTLVYRVVATPDAHGVTVRLHGAHGEKTIVQHLNITLPRPPETSTPIPSAPGSVTTMATVGDVMCGVVCFTYFYLTVNPVTYAGGVAATIACTLLCSPVGGTPPSSGGGGTGCINGCAK